MRENIAFVLERVVYGWMEGWVFTDTQTDW